MTDLQSAMHQKPTPQFSTEVYFTRPEFKTRSTTREKHHTAVVDYTVGRTTSASPNSTITFTGSATNATTTLPKSSKSNHNNYSAKGDFGAEVISGCVVGAAVGLVLIAAVIITIYKLKTKRINVRTARSNTQMSFDNLSYASEIGDRRNSIVSSIKRKVSAFSITSSTKENEQEVSRKISCGRLSIVETLESTSVDIGEIVQTIEV